MTSSDSFTAIFGHPTLITTHFIDENYSQKHARMLHTHSNTLELFYVYSGDGWYQVDGRWYPVHTGCMVICNSETIHGESPFQPNTMRSYCIALKGIQKPGLRSDCLTGRDDSPVLDLSENKELIQQLMERIHVLFSEADRNHLLCQSLANSILLLIDHEMQLNRQKHDNAVADKGELLLQQITDYLDTNYMNSISLDDISSELQISVSHLSHLFKRKTGLSPMQYVIYRRIGAAQTLLIETDQPIHQLEKQLGFGSSCHLTTMFKKYVGVSPKEYRKYFRNFHN